MRTTALLICVVLTSCSASQQSEDGRGGKADESSDSAADAGVDPVGSDDFLRCPVGCAIASCQASCSPSFSNIEDAAGGMVQYRHRVEMPRTVGATSPVACGALMEEYNCGACWGDWGMDRFWPRISYRVTNISDGTKTRHRVHVEYSWNGKAADGNPVPEFTTFTAILVRIEVLVRHPITDAILAHETRDLGVRDLNFGGYTWSDCHVTYSFDVDVDAVTSDAATNVVELVSIGNYE